MNDPRLEELIDRYARGELTGSEARRLAQQSLQDEGLFEELTTAALARSALSSVRLNEPEPRPWHAWSPRVWVGVSVAAAAVAIGFWSYPRVPPPPATVALPRPALASAAQPGQPVLLASNLHEAQPRFRGETGGDRPARLAGSILNVEDGIASIDLGSLDGLTQGTRLPVTSDGSRGPEAYLEVTDLFRERARCLIRSAGEVPVGAQVRVPDAVHWVALLDRLDSLAQQDPEKARLAAGNFLEWARQARLAPGLMRSGWLKLAALELNSGALSDAERHYQAAIDASDATPLPSAEERAAALNDIAVLRILRGDLQAAEPPLNQALSGGPRRDAQFARSLNNLGVLAELRGDRRLAESSYADALRLLSSLPALPARDRQSVEANLSRVRGAP